MIWTIFSIVVWTNIALVMFTAITTSKNNIDELFGDNERGIRELCNDDDDALALAMTLVIVVLVIPITIVSVIQLIVKKSK